MYYARVIGNFQEKNGNELICKKWLYCVSHKDAYWECSAPSEIPEEFKVKAKDAETLFKFKFYDKDSNTSVVKCYPKTGRTH